MYLKILLFSTLLTLLTITFLKIENIQRQIIVFLVFVIGCLVFTQTFTNMIDLNKNNNNIDGVLDKDITTNSVNNVSHNQIINMNNSNSGKACHCGNNPGACHCGNNPEAHVTVEITQEAHVTVEIIMIIMIIIIIFLKK